MVPILAPTVIVCGVDNDAGRVTAARLALRLRIPAVFTAVSLDADQGYCFIQVPGEACFGCLHPDAVTNEVTPCPNTPAIKDILKVVSGVVLYAVDSVLMGRPRAWNYRIIRLAGFLPDQAQVIARRPDCPLCGSPPAGQHG